MTSISKWLLWEARIRSPWFTAYPDVGNLTAWGNNVDRELQLGIDKIAAIHLKDTLPVSSSSPGQFRDVPFGKGCVDFVSVFRTRKKLNYRGTFLIEMWTEKSSEPVKELINARRWIESRLIEADWQTWESVHPKSSQYGSHQPARYVVALQDNGWTRIQHSEEQSRVFAATSESCKKDTD
jgi:L-ribulose-5-phosphate 3-epimerase UlaE